MDAALGARLGRDALLFVNCEPTARAVRRSEDPVLERGHAELQLVFELTVRQPA